MNRARALALAFLLAVGWGVPACGLNQEGVAPPPNTFFYPASAVLNDNPSGSWLFVTNSNADLRYNDGTLVMANVGGDQPGCDPVTTEGCYGAEDDRTTRATEWLPCPQADYVKTPRTKSTNPDAVHFCCWDQLDPYILNCDERAYIPGNNSVRIGSFAANMVSQKAQCLAPNDLNHCVGCISDQIPDRLYLAVRGNTSLTWMDVDGSMNPPRFICSDNPSVVGQAFGSCDGSHMVVQAQSALASNSPDPTGPVIPLPNEPYALAIDDYYGLLYLGHLTGDSSHPYTGGFSLFDVAIEGATRPKPRFIAPFPSPFPANANGFVGITAFTKVAHDDGGSPPTLLPPTIYASSRYVPVVSSLGATATCDPGPKPDQRIRDIAAYPSGETYSTTLSGAETRGIEFVDGRPFVLQRIPPALVGFDGGTATTVLETCSSPTFLYKYDAGGGAGERLFVNCFDTGEVYVFDPIVPHLVQTFQIGRGPAGMVFSTSPINHKPIAYVVGFGDNNISVVDLDPTSPTEYHVIQRIGFPSTVPR